MLEPKVELFMAFNLKGEETMDYIPVSEEEGEEPIELPAEEDGTLLLSTVQAQFPGCCGLKCRNEETNAARGVRLCEGRFYPPVGEIGNWGSRVYFCVFPKENKRKRDDNSENSTAKTKRIERLRCTDLIVLGLSFKTTEEGLREYFEEKYGAVIMAQVKKDFKTGQSKGFGFIRFESYESQVRALAARHLIDQRWCEVKIPNSKEGVAQQLPSKIFVGRCTEDIKVEDLREYFSKFGEVADVFIPRPFRAFSFVTFLDPEVAQSLCGEDHIIKGVSVYVSNAAPKTDRNVNQQNMNSYNNNAMMNRGGNNLGGGYSGGYGDNSGGYNGSSYNGGGYGMNGGMNSQYGRGRNDGNGGYGMNSTSRSGGGSWNNSSQNRGNLDMPNLQALGINPQGQNSSSSQGSSMNNNPMGGSGLNLGSMPMNPAIVAAALNQWGLLNGGFQNQSQQDQGSGNSGSPSWPRKSNGSSQGPDQPTKFT